MIYWGVQRSSIVMGDLACTLKITFFWKKMSALVYITVCRVQLSKKLKIDPNKSTNLTNFVQDHL